MGTIACCNEIRSYKTENTYIYQINRYVKYNDKDSKLLPDSQRDTISSLSGKDNEEKNNIKKKNSKKQYLKNKNGDFLILSYDVEEEYFLEYKITIPIIRTIEGMSELNINKKLILCGISPKQKNEGSFLFKIDLEKKAYEDEEHNNVEVLINSIFPHIYPSLIYDKSGKILCIGGKRQIQCESYNLSKNKWFTLPQLHEERYKCSLCLDSKGNYVYLFGGINNSNINTSVENDAQIKILRLNLHRLLIWENLIIKNSSKNLFINRISSAAFTFKFDEDFIFIVGGEDLNGNQLDNILRFSIKKLKFESTGARLKSKAIFLNQNGVSMNEQAHCLIDNFNEIHIIERHDCLPMDYHPDEI